MIGNVIWRQYSRFLNHLDMYETRNKEGMVPKKKSTESCSTRSIWHFARFCRWHLQQRQRIKNCLSIEAKDSCSYFVRITCYIVDDSLEKGCYLIGSFCYSSHHQTFFLWHVILIKMISLTCNFSSWIVASCVNQCGEDCIWIVVDTMIHANLMLLLCSIRNNMIAAEILENTMYFDNVLTVEWRGKVAWCMMQTWWF